VWAHEEILLLCEVVGITGTTIGYTAVVAHVVAVDAAAIATRGVGWPLWWWWQFVNLQSRVSLMEDRIYAAVHWQPHWTLHKHNFEGSLAYLHRRLARPGLLLYIH